MPAPVIAAMPLMEDHGMAIRLASLRDFPGCFEGYVTDLARHWLDHQGSAVRAEVEVFACGPTPMLKAVMACAANTVSPVKSRSRSSWPARSAAAPAAPCA